MYKEDILEEERLLTIKKPDLLGQSKLEVISDQIINVDIADENFSHKIRSGEIKLYAGCKIRVKMITKMLIDESYNVISQPEYIVKEVVELFDK